MSELRRNVVIRMVHSLTCRKDGEAVKRACNHRLVGFNDDGSKTALARLPDESKKEEKQEQERLRIEIFETSELDALIASGVATVLNPKPPTHKETPGIKAYRDQARILMAPFADNPKFLFNCQLRAELVRTAAKIGNVTEKKVRRTLKRYVEAGMNIFGLWPKWYNCGTPVSEQGRMNEKRLGRPDSLAQFRELLTGRPPSEDLDARFEKGYQTHVKGVVNKHVSRPLAFRRTLFDFFTVEVEPGKPERQFEKDLPTENQFDEYIKTHHTRAEIRESRQSKAQHGTTDREQTSQSKTLDPRGPGDCYQIDSTIADVYAVRSDGSRHLIGRPVLYLVIDVWSRMIVGFHLSLRAACYDEMIVALLSVLEDKEQLCRRWGVEYHPEDWPETPFPTMLIADRQEVIYANSNLLFDLGITLVNAPPYRGDLKGIIEDALGRLMRKAWTLPGGVDHDRPKDHRDYREDAIYTFPEIGNIFLKEVILLNHRHLPQVPVPPEFVTSREDKIPIKLFAWGMKELSGCGMTIDYETARRELLPYVKAAHTSEKGITVSAAGVKGLDYIAPSGAFPKDIFKRKGGIVVKAQYDARQVDFIWVRHPETDELIQCKLDERNFREYFGMTWPMAAAYQDRLDQRGAQIVEENYRRELVYYTEEKAMAITAFERATAHGPQPRKGPKEDQKDHREADHAKIVESQPPVEVHQVTPIDESKLF